MSDTGIMIIAGALLVGLIVFIYRKKDFTFKDGKASFEDPKKPKDTIHIGRDNINSPINANNTVNDKR